MTRKIKILAGTAGGVITSFAAGTQMVFAEEVLNAPKGFENLSKIDFNTAIPGIIRLLLVVAFVIAFIFLIIGGIRWILSGGDKAAAETARGTLTAAIIGLIVVLLAWLLISIIEALFGVCIINCTEIQIPPLFNANIP